MLTILSGPFHPVLENEFISRIKNMRRDPFEKVAIVVPSSRLLERIQLILAKNGVSALNLFFFTFSTLAREIVENDGSLAKTILGDPLFFDTLVRYIQREDRPFQGFQDLAIPEGFPSAVRSTLRDMADAGIPPAIQKEAIKEGYLGTEVDIGSLKQLLLLYQIYLTRIEHLPVLPKSALITEATRLALDSPFLGRFKELIYYGFYDLTGIQVDFFQAVVKKHPATLFFPYAADEPAYKFAGSFKDNHLQSVTNKEEALDSPEIPSDPEIKIFNISGLRDEAWIVAQEILRLHEEYGVPYHEIAVVSRHKERLQDEMPRLLGERKIPFRAVAGNSLGEIPLTATALEALKELPDRESWPGFVQKAFEILEKNLGPVLGESGDLWKLMREGLESLAGFQLLKSDLSRDEFLEVLRDRWKQTELPTENEYAFGVPLLYAEQARGLSFRVIFIVGMEERVYPRIIREDPFLRDNARSAITNTLGYKIPQKMAALEEERLLFHLLISAAGEKIFLTYQRSDEKGAVVGPSSFLRSYVEKRGLKFDEAVETIPRSYYEKLDGWPPEFQGERDLTVRQLVAGEERGALEFAHNSGRDASALKRGLKMMRELQSFKNPGVLDGLIGKYFVERFFKNRALSPSRLEIFGLCPFKFLAVRGFPRPLFW